jgi:hypothetical protein
MGVYNRAYQNPGCSREGTTKMTEKSVQHQTHFLAELRRYSGDALDISRRDQPQRSATLHSLFDDVDTGRKDAAKIFDEIEMTPSKEQDGEVGGKYKRVGAAYNEHTHRNFNVVLNAGNSLRWCRVGIHQLRHRWE